MNRHNEMSFGIMFCVLIMTISAADAVTLQPAFVTAYMDRRQSDQVYGCGDTIEDTVSGEISAFIPAFTSAFNCSLAVISPPGTQLSLTVTHLHLVTLNLNTCKGNRVKILGDDGEGDDGEGSPSLLRSFPNGLCGYTKPSQSVLTPDNQVHLVMESLSTDVQNTFNISYTAFKTTPDEECFACDVGDSPGTPFCIDQRLVCDNRQNCPENTEETSTNCMAPSAPPSVFGNVVVIVVVCVLAVMLIAVIIFVILAVMTKRAHSKRNRGSGGADRAERASRRQSHRDEAAPPDLRVDPDYRQGYTGVYELAEHHPPPPLLLPNHPLQAPPAFTVNGEYPAGFQPATTDRLPAAPPAYSTLPRPMERSLQIAENTNLTSRSRIASTDGEVEPHTP